MKPRGASQNLIAVVPSDSLLWLPNELLYMIGEHLETDPNGGLKALAALSSTCRRFNAIYDDRLYRSDALYYESKAIVWGATLASVGTIEKSIAQGGDVNAYYETLHTSGGRALVSALGSALHYAVLTGFDGIVECLLDHGADIHAKNAISICECYNIFRSVPQHPPIRACSDVAFRYPKSALHLAICHGHISTARLLIDRGALEGPDNEFEERHDLMIAAVAFGHHCLFDSLLEGMNPQDISDLLETPDNDLMNNSLLHFACGRRSNIETVRALRRFELTIDTFIFSVVNRPNGGRKWPLAIALEEGTWETVLFLIANGDGSIMVGISLQDEIWAFLNRYDSDLAKSDLLDNSWRGDARKVMGLMVEKYKKRSQNFDPSRDLMKLVVKVLDRSWFFNHPSEIITLLLDLGADPNLRVDNHGSTVLHFLFMPDSPGKVQASDEETRLDREMKQLSAIYRQHKNTILELLKHGASLNYEDKHKMTVLKYLTTAYNPERGSRPYKILVSRIVRFLLAHVQPRRINRMNREIWTDWIGTQARELSRDDTGNPSPAETPVSTRTRAHNRHKLIGTTPYILDSAGRCIGKIHRMGRGAEDWLWEERYLDCVDPKSRACRCAEHGNDHTADAMDLTE
ncbi:hypothetical protein B0H66DRAFT_560130 [Apodospora peruviana]|uniref:Ankyrin n=1 Tax=Apodospora peruviana TaxID=516989 RepID=A0AAE0I0H4_9PEZI|nr:hypothetical protein B0H66DRAFT_560130 [Apodospora peruviana]